MRSANSNFLRQYTAGPCLAFKGDSVTKHAFSLTGLLLPTVSPFPKAFWSIKSIVSSFCAILTFLAGFKINSLFVNFPQQTDNLLQLDSNPQPLSS